MTFILNISIYDTLSLWKNTHGTCYILTANCNFMKKTDKNENENFECLTPTSSSNSALEPKKISIKKKNDPKSFKKVFFLVLTPCWNF